MQLHNFPRMRLTGAAALACAAALIPVGASAATAGSSASEGRSAPSVSTGPQATCTTSADAPDAGAYATVPAASPAYLAKPARPVTAYVVSYFGGTVTPILTAANTALKPITVGRLPFTIAITPDGKTAYVNGSAGVTPISTATNTAGKAITIKAPGEVEVIAITPNSKTAYVASSPLCHTGTVTPVNTATNKAGGAIKIGKGPTSPPTRA